VIAAPYGLASNVGFRFRGRLLARNTGGHSPETLLVLVNSRAEASPPNPGTRSQFGRRRRIVNPACTRETPNQHRQRISQSR
jgi:hypothetical protein